MEGGFVTLIIGTILVVLFTDASTEERKNSAARNAIIAASGLGLLVSGVFRDLSLVMALGLGLLAVGLISQFLMATTAPRTQR